MQLVSPDSPTYTSQVKPFFVDVSTSLGVPKQLRGLHSSSVTSMLKLNSSSLTLVAELWKVTLKSPVFTPPGGGGGGDGGDGGGGVGGNGGGGGGGLTAHHKNLYWRIDVYFDSTPNKYRFG